jgi:formate-dependent nitrite reductase membrane component NrfD
MTFGRPAPRRRLTWFALIAGGAELFFAGQAARNFRREGVAAPIESAPLGLAWRYGVFGLGILAPLALHAYELFSGRESRRLSSAASILTLAGGVLLRASLVFSGKRSSQRPRDYFRLAQPAHARRYSAGAVIHGRSESYE